MTTQIRDKLIYKGKIYYLNDELLEKYFKQFPEHKPAVDGSFSALWRGYIATFEIQDNEFFLTEMEVIANTELNTASILNQVFPDSKKMDWYSGLIRISGFQGRFDKEPKDAIFELLEIHQGNVVQKRIMNFDELQAFKQEQYEYFLLSDDVEPIYELFKKNNKGITETRINEIIRDYILFYTTEVYVD